MTEHKVYKLLGQILCDRSLRKPSMGICGCIQELIDALPYVTKLEQYHVDKLNSDWYKGSGSAFHEWCSMRGYEISLIFPVPPSSDHGFCSASDDGTMWKGDYGNRRKDLLRFCYHYFKSRNI